MWLHIPTSVCSAESECSTSLSESQSQALAALVTVSGKDRRPPYWLLAWRKAVWMRRLSGLTLEPSLANTSVAAWLDSLEGSPAPTCPSPERKQESTENTAASSLKLSDSFAIWNPSSGSFSKTSLRFSLFPQDIPYSENLPKSGSMRNGELYERPKLVRRTAASVCSSMRRDAALARPTPKVNDGEHPGRAKSKDGQEFPLSMAANLWPTPRSEDSEACGNHPGATDSLTGATKEWQTPATDSFRSRGGDRKDEMGLDQQSRFWATPRTITGGGETAERKQELGREESGGGDLQAQVQMWNTPASRAYRSPNANPDQHPDQLANQAYHSFPQDQPTETHGDKFSPSGQTSRRRLNPAFVEWLMNLPGGWTDFAPLGMEWSRYARRLRTEYLRIVGDSAVEATTEAEELGA